MTEEIINIEMVKTGTDTLFMYICMNNKYILHEWSLDEISGIIFVLS